jgi:Ca2+-binding RTX toxin-like protein
MTSLASASSTPNLAALWRIYWEALTSGKIIPEQLLGNFIANPTAFANVDITAYQPTFGTNQDDVIQGTEGDDLIWGLDGDDIIEGFAGNDIIDGGNGADSLIAGTGRDIVFGGNGDDVLRAEDQGSLFGGSGNDFISGGASGQFDDVSGGSGVDTIQIGATSNLFGRVGVSNLVRGDDGDDVIRGVNVKRISGGRGNDTISGSAGFIFRFPPPGRLDTDVTITGDDGNDVIDYGLSLAGLGSSVSGGRGDDLIDVSSGTVNGGEENDIIFISDSSDFAVNGVRGKTVANGGSGNDRLTATVRGTKTLNGGEGRDTLSGTLITSLSEQPLDTMTGGAGQDRFGLGDATGVFYNDGDPTTSGDEPDSRGYATITDFRIGQDIIQLKGSASDYRLNFFNENGVSKAKLFYTQGQTAPDRIAILENVSTGLSLNSSSFSYV